MKTIFVILATETKPLFIEKEININIQKGDYVLIDNKAYTCASRVVDIDRDIFTLYLTTNKYIYENNINK